MNIGLHLFPEIVNTYNANGQLQTLIYPSGFAVKYSYNPTGKLSTIRRNDDNSLIYSVNTLNKFYAPLSCSYGNGVNTDYEYNEYGLLTHIQTGNKYATLGHDRGGSEFILINAQLVYSLDSAILNYRYAYDTYVEH